MSARPRLLLDLGNTRLKWALVPPGGALGAVQAEPHHDRPAELFLAREWPVVSEVWLSAVPRLADPAAWSAAVQTRCGFAPHCVQSAAEWQGLRNCYAEPQRLGVDRWLAMVALWQRLRGSFLVVSAGTALTVDRVAADGGHRGGIIAPGYGSTLAALLKVTATAAQALPALPADRLGQGSEAAIRQGALFAALGAIDRCRALPDADPAEQLVLTGGDAATLHPHLGTAWQMSSDLVLEGLLALATDPLAAYTARLQQRWPA